MFKIDHKVPVPLTKKKLPYKYPWIEMKAGDSFFVPNGRITNIRSTASSAGRRYSKQFVAKEVEGGVRVWRVK